MRPYASKLQEMLSNIVSNSEGGNSIALAEERQVKKVLMIVVTSDRGLCGAYNANIQKMAIATIVEKYAAVQAAGNLTIWAIGKKGAEFFQKRGYNVDVRFKDTFLKLSFETVQACAQAAVQAFKQKEFDAIEIVYSEFKNAATQRYAAEVFLPIPKNEPAKGGSSKKSDFIFEPDKDLLIAELMPKILNTQLFKAVLDGNASEHGARMTAMDKASENANELLKSLKISYNRARQAAITTELTEIVSGAAALQG
jgi:F-type H+-transporting ATPase subunit gamma